MKPDYKNWVPKGMIYGLGAATVGLAGAADGLFMGKLESRVIMLYGSTLLVGRK